MIVREWRARAGNEKACIYPRDFREAVLRLRTLEGFVAASVFARTLDGHVEFVVMTRWQSLECVRAFTGPEIDAAVVEPAAAMALVSYDHAVQHYDVIEDAVVPLP